MPRRIPLLGAVLLALAASAGCAAGPTSTVASTSPSPSPSALTAAADAIELSSGVDLTSDHRATQLNPKQAILVGPHSVLQVDAIASESYLSSDWASVLGLPTSYPVDQPVEPAAGHEFVLAHLANTDVEPELASGDTAGASKATVVVDGQERQFPSEIAGGETIMVSVPTGAPVHLRMNDGGKPQELDLRTGKRTRAASPLYYPQLTADIAVPGIGLWAGGTWVGADISGGSAALSPYADGHGWASGGHAWLLVWLPLTQSDKHKLTAGQLGLSVSLPDGSDANGSWSVGEPTSPMAGVSITEQAIVGRFAVPASIRSATLIVNPPGGFTTDSKSYSDPLHLPIKLTAS